MRIFIFIELVDALQFLIYKMAIIKVGYEAHVFMIFTGGGTFGWASLALSSLEKDVSICSFAVVETVK